MMHIIFIIACLGMGSAIMTYFLHFCMGRPDGDEVDDRMIFSRYGVWVNHNFKVYEQKVTDSLTRQNLTPYQQDMKSARMLNRFKFMGACVWCFNVWVTFGCASIGLWLTELSFWFLLIIPSISHVSLSAIYKYLD